MISKNIGGFDCNFFDNSSKQVAILLHGYGANKDDLAPLVEYLDPKKEFDWILPQAPISLSSIPGIFESKAWFMLDASILMSLYQTRDFSVFAKQNPADFQRISAKLELLINELYRNYPRGVVLGGFSQGAILSMELTLRQYAKLKGTILFSAALFNSDNWAENSNKIPSNYPIFQCHGTIDQVLSYELGKSVSRLIEKGEKRIFATFPGGHEIPLEIITKAKKFLYEL